MSWEIREGDCIEVMAAMPDCSVDAVVTDPPYGIGFMGHDWDQPGLEMPEKREGVPSGQRRSSQPSPTSGEGHERDRQAKRNGVRFTGPTGRDNTTHTERGGAMHAGRYDLSRTANQAYQAWCEAWARECFRILKPGGHLLASCGSRTYHRLAAGIEDAGFEIRDSIMWLYGSGFPKSLDVSKAIDKAAGAEREVVGHYTMPADSDAGNAGQIIRGDGADSMFGVTAGNEGTPITAAATPEAAEWEGWGTALKPAHEPIVVARKPLVGTVAQNVLAFGTGGINVDACRIGSGTGGDRDGEASAERRYTENGSTDFAPTPGPRGGDSAGRWPANLILSHTEDCVPVGVRRVRGSGQHLEHHARATAGGNGTTHGAMAGTTGADHVDSDGLECAPGCPVAALDAQSGVLHGHGSKRHGGSDKGIFDWGTADRPQVGGESGGASRFFYCAKTSRAERNAGQPEGMTNDHPTVKPINLMRWLVRLVTPPGGTCLDPFMGSGSTGCAAVLEGFDFIGIEREPEYIAIAEARIAFWAQHEGREVEDVLQLAGKSQRQATALAEMGQIDLLAEDAA